MPFNAIHEYDPATALNNSDIGSNNIAEGCAPGGINNALRELCRQLRRAVANQGADIASAATTNIGAATGQYVRVTGTTAITSLGTVNAGTMRWVEFTGSLTLTNGANIILPGGANIVTQAGDVAVFVSRGAGVWKMLDYMPGNQTVRCAFHAHKNEIDQAGIAPTTWTKLTFATERFDVGGHYDAANSRFTPPAGKYRLSAAAILAGGVVDQARFILGLYKNGSPHNYGENAASGTPYNGIGVTANVDANGSDYFEVYLYGAGAGNKTVNGTTEYTYFCGERIA